MNLHTSKALGMTASGVQDDDYVEVGFHDVYKCRSTFTPINYVAV